MTLRETEGENEWEKERNSVKYLRAIERKCADDDKTNRENFVSFLRYWPFAYSMNNGRARIQMHAHTHKHINREGGKERIGTKIILRSVVIQTKIECDSILFQITYGIFYMQKSVLRFYNAHNSLKNVFFSLSTCSRMSSVLFL